MTNTQLYLAIGLPTLTALLGIFTTLVGLLLQSKHLDERFKALEGRLDRMGAQTDSRLDRMDARLDLIQRDQREFYATQKQHDTRLESLERKIEKV